MFFGNDGPIQKGGALFGRKLQEAGEFLSRMEPQNAQALLAAGLTMMQGEDMGTAGLRGMAAANQERERINQFRNRQKLTEIQEQNALTAMGNSRVAGFRAQTAADREKRLAGVPSSTPGKILDDYHKIVEEYGPGSPEVADFLRFAEKSGVRLDFGEDGQIRSFRMGGSGGPSTDLTKSNITQVQDKLMNQRTLHSAVQSLRNSVDQSKPWDFGLVGELRTNVGAALGQFGLEGGESFITPEGDVREEARLVGLQLAETIVNEPRITKEEREETRRMLNILENTSSKHLAMKSLDVILRVSERLMEESAGDLKDGAPTSMSGDSGDPDIEAALRALEGK